jgi:small subunit ribosomal protein S16
MAVKIRLSRIGKKSAPFYRIVAIDSRKKRDGEFLENLGTYDALNPQLVQFHEDRIQYWMSVGAQPSLTVQKLHRLFKKGAAPTGK